MRQYSDITATSCPHWKMQAATIQNLEVVQISMDQAWALLAPGHVYSYYKSIVHDMVCGSMPARLMFAVLLQAAQGAGGGPGVFCEGSSKDTAPSSAVPICFDRGSTKPSPRGQKEHSSLRSTARRRLVYLSCLVSSP